jgi:hypothetical protein
MGQGQGKEKRKRKGESSSPAEPEIATGTEKAERRNDTHWDEHSQKWVISHDWDVKSSASSSSSTSSTSTTSEATSETPRAVRPPASHDTGILSVFAVPGTPSLYESRGGAWKKFSTSSVE